MSSISTLEVAWENWAYKWSWLGETLFCWKVARTNKLELLKWIREEKKCEWDGKTIHAAAYNGNLEMVMYCVANECPVDEDACAHAADGGRLEVLKYLREEVKAPWDWKTADWAASNGHLHILEYLVERKYDEYNAWACENAARNGHLDCLKYLHETAKAPWNSDVVRNYRTIDAAAEQGNLEMVKYCVANECPIDAFACAWAAENGHLECLKYLHEEVKAPWESCTSSWAALNGHLHILEYLVERKFDKYSAHACEVAAKNGHLDCLKYLHETAKAPWDSRAVRYAHKKNQTECVQYLLDNNCPLPRGWSHKYGELHTS